MMQGNGINESNTRVLRSSKYNFLIRELEFWKNENLITQEQLSGIRALYEPSGSIFGKVLINLGAVLIGSALLSYIAANWMEFSRVTKISLILITYVFSVLSAWLTDKRSPVLSRALLLLSSFAYGGGIFLIAQIFHEGGHYTTALLFWIAGITPVCAIFKDRLQLTLIQVLSFIYLFGIHVDSFYPLRDFDGSVLTALSFLKWQIVLVAGLWVLWLRTRGRISFNLNILFTICFICWLSQVFSVRVSDITAGLFCLGVIFVLFPRDSDVNVWGVVLIGTCGLSMTYRHFWRDFFRYGPVDLPDFINNLIPGLSGKLSPELLAVCAGILTCVLLILFMLRGSSLAVFFFSAVIMRYFFDKFYDFMPKSVAFAIGGIILIAAGLLIGKMRRIKKNKNAVNAAKEVNS